MHLLHLLVIATACLFTMGSAISADPKPKEKPDSSTASKSTAKAETTDADTAELQKAEAMLKELSSSRKGSLTRLLNSGDKKALMELPGIGDATADAIIKARPLKSSAHLVLVKGVGEKTFANIVKSRK